MSENENSTNVKSLLDQQRIYLGTNHHKDEKIVAIENAPLINNETGHIPPPVKINDFTIIWKYFKVGKFQKMLENNYLYFSRLDQFPQDDKEGIPPEVVRRSIVDESRFPGEKQTQQLKLFEERTKLERLYRFVSCWNISDHEKEFMWKEYVGECNGVVIKSSVKKLSKVLQSNTYIDQVRYFDGNITNQDFYLYPYLFKQKKFVDDCELRCHFRETEENITRQTQAKGLVSVTGIGHKINLDELIDEIHISPFSSNSFLRQVNDICGKYNLETTVTKSELVD